MPTTSYEQTNWGKMMKPLRRREKMRNKERGREWKVYVRRKRRVQTNMALTDKVASLHIYCLTLYTLLKDLKNKQGIFFLKYNNGTAKRLNRCSWQSRGKICFAKILKEPFIDFKIFTINISRCPYCLRRYDEKLVQSFGDCCSCWLERSSMSFKVAESETLNVFQFAFWSLPAHCLAFLPTE